MIDDFAASALASLLTPRQRAERLTGRTLGRWTLDSRASAGGFSVVYNARHPQLGDGVVKVLAFDANENPEARRFFEREIRILKKLTDDPQVQFVPRIYDAEVDEDEGLAWVAMQRIDGQSLAEYLHKARSDQKRLSTGQIVQVLRGVLTALATVQEAYATQSEIKGCENPDAALLGRAIVHGDIKPGNVLVEEVGGGIRAWLVDFGIARIHRPAKDRQSAPITQSPEATMTVTASAFTREYASPELLAPHPQVDPRSDLFQLGLIGYEMITGSRYWDVWPDVERDLRVAPCPRWLKQSVSRALDWNRDRRFEDARDFLRAVGAWQTRLRVRCRANAKAVALFVAMLLVLVVAVKSWTDYQNGRVRVVQLSSTNNSGPSRRDALDQMKGWYNQLLSGKASANTIELLKQSAEAFTNKWPNDADTDAMDQLATCLGAMQTGTVTISVLRIEVKKDYGYYYTWKVHLAISCNGKTLGPWEPPVKSELEINQKFDEPWRPDGNVVVDLNCQKAGDDAHGTQTIPLASKQILQDDPLPGRVATNDNNFDVVYEIARNFSNLPPFPEQ